MEIFISDKRLDFTKQSKEYQAVINYERKHNLNSLFMKIITDTVTTYYLLKRGSYEIYEIATL